MAGEPLNALHITRTGLAPTKVEGGWIEIDRSMFAAADVVGGQIRVPNGWDVETLGDGTWGIRPTRLHVRRGADVVLVDADGVTRDSIRVPVTYNLRSSFEIKRHAFGKPNSAAALGTIDPDRRIFDATYASMPQALKNILFRGLYSDIVFIRPGARTGGLCTGMARWAIARGLGREPEPVNEAVALERIVVFHGRQLFDRALLAAAGWFFRASPRAAFYAVRDDLLRSGTTDRALDIAVPKPWRRDVLQAVVEQGHTVVPYHLVQESDDYGWIAVYDPNRPDLIDSDEPRMIEFDLRRDRYAYGTKVSFDQDNVGIVAVRQDVYMGKRSAVLATIGSALKSLLRVGGRRDG
ncbi:MAG: hypothetical protein M9890_03530 [Thermomicrobiales bacterium]|nr:hypothetical protein [Thermomicrobiales bacterium]